jgi:hypothetical protein
MVCESPDFLIQKIKGMSFNIQITSAEELKAHIRLMEQRNRVLEDDIKGGFEDLGNSMKPSNLLHDAIDQAKTSPAFRSNLVKAAVGIGLGLYLKKKFVPGKSGSILKNAAGAALKIGIANLVGRKFGLGAKIFGRVFSRSGARA